MANIIQDVAGVDFMTEKDIVTELLLTSKNALNRYASVLSEAVTPQVRETLKNHLNQIIDFQGQIAAYALNRGYLRPFDPEAQIKDDLKEAYTALDWKPGSCSPEKSFSGRRGYSNRQVMRKHAFSFRRKTGKIMRRSI
jgi:spore coat protein CotF